MITFLRKLGHDPQLRNIDFRRFWFSSVLSNFGAQVTLLALPICAALLLHATPAQMGTLAALGSLPFLLFGLPVGVLLDRSRRLPVMLCSDAMVALSLASVPIAWWQGWLSIHWLYAVEFVLGTGYVVGGGAEQIFVTFLVGRDGLIDAQSKFAATESASRLLGPGLAGVLVQALGAPFAILCNVHDGGDGAGGAAGAGLLAERIGVRGGLGIVAAGALLLTAGTLFGTRLHRIRA